MYPVGVGAIPRCLDRHPTYVDVLARKHVHVEELAVDRGDSPDPRIRNKAER